MMNRKQPSIRDIDGFVVVGDAYAPPGTVFVYNKASLWFEPLEIKWYHRLMSDYTSKSFWVSTIERSLKTAAQVAAASLTVDQFYGIGWPVLGALVGYSALYSVLTSIGSAKVGPKRDPSLI